jgi:hypothetical protein
MIGRTLRARPEWRLTVHFSRALFDFGILSEAGVDSLKHVFLGAVGGFVAAGWLLLRVYVSRYARLWASPSPEPYRRALLGDDLFIIGLPMLLVAFLTLLVSASLFPDERDFRILGPLPVRRQAVFGAKLAALALFVGGFVVVVHAALFPLFLLISRNPWGEHEFVPRLTAWMVASVAGSACAMLAITAIVGLLVLVFTGGRLHAVSATARSALLGVLVVCVPMVLRLPTQGGAFAGEAWWLWLAPPAWFVALERLLTGSGTPFFASLAAVGIATLGVAGVVVAVGYAVLFRHFERLVLRPPDRTSGSSSAVSRRGATEVSPAYLAIRDFTTLTLRRSALHQSVLIGLSACGLGLALGGGLWTPFALTVACGAAVRAALVLPVEHRANWIFRMTEDGRTRADGLRAVDRLATAWVVGPPTVMSAVVFWPRFGWWALAGALVVTLMALAFVHVVLLDWRRIPFTCSYLPGKRFVAQSLSVAIGALAVTVAVGTALVVIATNRARSAGLILAAAALTAYVLRRQRLNTWRKTPLMFEDELPDQPMPLRLGQ